MPDPADPATSIGRAAVVDIVPPGRIGFLLFGYLTERKGPLMVLDALRLLPERVAPAWPCCLPAASIPRSATASRPGATCWPGNSRSCGCASRIAGSIAPSSTAS